MTAKQGQFVWCELMTTDAEAATEFYRDVIGWNVADAGIPDVPYTVLSAGEAPIGGLVAMPKEACDAGAKPGWVGYIGVDDVDAMAKRAVEAGGSIERGPADIPSVGRFAVVKDPHGAAFMLFKGAGEMPPSPSPAALGVVGWKELMAGDREAAFTFYARLFGWTKAEAIDMGAMGTYQIFSIGGVQAGGMMTCPKDAGVPGWRYYFNVDEINRGVKRAKEAGGALVNGPMEVPGGAWIAHCTDKQGVGFAMVAMPRG